MENETKHLEERLFDKNKPVEKNGKNPPEPPRQRLSQIKIDQEGHYDEDGVSYDREEGVIVASDASKK